MMRDLQRHVRVLLNQEDAGAVAIGLGNDEVTERIEQWHHGLCLGIKRCGEVVAIAITALAGQREVVETM